MTSRRRFVDAHVHLWDRTANAWYGFPTPGKNDFGLGLKQPFPDIYLWDDYLTSVATVDLAKWVHVTAVTDTRDVEAETGWVAATARGRGLPFALIGSVDLALPIARIEAMLDRETAHPEYRGLRLLRGADYDTDPTRHVLSLLASRGLVYDAVANPGGIATAARGLDRYPDLAVVLEHTGWPRATDDAHFAQWREEMAIFAQRPNSYCKLSGLGMTVHRNDTAIFARFFDECIALFGPERCMFASNFPVDLSYGTGAELFDVFETVAGSYSDAEAAALYAGTAERVYRI